MLCTMGSSTSVSTSTTGFVWRRSISPFGLR
jgi:hypothetical protein